ncbi:hypothetical protein H0H92_014578 [Tricholoma furcatifolium]|nr:hypothetical protein H0H92_014578 [Tricholoma furcatifolium]
MFLPISYELANERVENVYEPLADQIMAMGNASLANATYGTDFVSSVEDWSKNVVYRDAGAAETEFRCNIFGQVAIEEHGTIIAAKGNYYAGKTGAKFTPLSDDHRVKDVLVLETPTFAGGRLERLFLNQVGGLNDILTKEETEDKKKNIVMECREWVRNAANDKLNPANMVVLHMMRKYDNPNKGVKRLAKQSLTDFEKNGPPTSQEASAGDTASIAEPAVVEGGFYDPRLNADFRGDYFNLVNNKLVQLDVLDQDNRLVAPWKFYDTLKPGTLILANCSLHCFIMRNGKSDSRKIYQINAHSIKIIDPSDGRPIPQVIPIVPSNAAKAKTTVIVGKSSTDAFANFCINKRKQPATSSGSSSTTTSESTPKRVKKDKGSESKKKDSSDKGKKDLLIPNDFEMID